MALWTPGRPGGSGTFKQLGGPYEQHTRPGLESPAQTTAPPQPWPPAVPVGRRTTAWRAELFMGGRRGSEGCDVSN